MESGERRVENGELRTESYFPFSVFRFPFSVLCFPFSVFFFFLSCSPSVPPSPMLAKVNGKTISLEAFQKYRAMGQWKFPSAKDSKNKILDQFLKEELLSAEAEKKGLVVSEKEIEESLQSFKKNYAREEDFEKLLASKGWTSQDFKEEWARGVLIKKLSEQVGASSAPLIDRELQSYYQTQLGSFRHAEQVHARQIVTDSKEKGAALRGMLEKGASFEETALKYSLSPDRKRGGDLGWFERGIMPKEFDAICFSLETGKVSPVVPTPYGFHIFQVLERRPGGLSSFEEVKETIRQKISAEKGSAAFQKWYDQFKKEAKIEIYEDTFNQIQ